MEITPTIEPKTNITKRETMQKKRKISIKMNFTPTPLDQHIPCHEGMTIGKVSCFLPPIEPFF